MGTDAVRPITVDFPIDVLSLLDSVVPAKERDRFIVEATEEALRRAKLRHALEASAGAWSDKDHPDLMSVKDVDRYIRRLRETSMPRTWDEIAEEAEAEMHRSGKQSKDG